MPTDWTIPGAEGETIRGTAHEPAGRPRAALTIFHGLKGYKDYGLFPVLAQRACERLPVVAHRFNGSHSGIGDDPSTFQRPDLFERDTWNKQVADVRAVTRAAREGELPGAAGGLPVIALGHSRGGVSALLAQGRSGDPSEKADAVVTLSASSWTCSMDDRQRRELLERGWLPMESARTGQELRVGRAWLAEQMEDPEGHDVLALCRNIEAPVLVVHGRDDGTVPVRCAEQIVRECRDAELAVVEGGDHVYNTPNPAPVGGEPSPQLARLIDEVCAFIERRVPAVEPR